MKKFCKHLLDDDTQCIIDGEPCEFEGESDAEDMCMNFDSPELDCEDEDDGIPI